MTRTAHPQTTQGFTLVELMVVLAIAAIVAIVGIPSMYSMIANNRLATQSNELVASINLARSEAIKRGQTVVLCKSNDDGTACDNAATWDKGWLIFEDTNRNNILDGEQIIRANSGIPNSITVNYVGGNTIIYNAAGRIISPAASFSLSDSEGKVKTHNITIELTGRAKTEVDHS